MWSEEVLLKSTWEKKMLGVNSNGNLLHERAAHVYSNNRDSPFLSLHSIMLSRGDRGFCSFQRQFVCPVRVYPHVRQPEKFVLGDEVKRNPSDRLPENTLSRTIPPTSLMMHRSFTTRIY
jgi:hypothetical protein